MSLMRTAVLAGIFSASGLALGASPVKGQCGCGGQAYSTAWTGYTTPYYDSYVYGTTYAPTPVYSGVGSSVATPRTTYSSFPGYLRSGPAASANRDWATGRVIPLAKPWLRPLR